MADVNLKLNLQALAPMFEQRVLDMARHPDVLGFFAARDIESVEDLTPRQQAKFVLHMTVKAWQEQYVRREAELAGEAAAKLAAEAFEIEVD